MTKHKKEKRTKLDKKQKHVNISNKNEIHIKIENGKKKTNKKKGQGIVKSFFNNRQLPQAASYVQLPAPTVPLKPELDYSNLAKVYLTKPKVSVIEPVETKIEPTTPEKTPAKKHQRRHLSNSHLL